MNSLIVYGQLRFCFNEAELFRKLQDISDVYRLEQGCFVGANLQCVYQCNGDLTIVRLSDDLSTITIADAGAASFQLALELQQREDQPLFVTDFGFDYNLVLQGLRSLDELKRNILTSLDFAAA